MGIAAQRKKVFYAKYPFCCICGGGVLATTQDHIRSRSLFRQRQWPEGYVFSACNALTAPNETLTALLCRIASRNGADVQTKREVRELMRTVAQT